MWCWIDAEGRREKRCVSSARLYLYRGLIGEIKKIGRKKKRDRTKASAQLATSSLMKAVAAIQ